MYRDVAQPSPISTSWEIAFYWFTGIPFVTHLASVSMTLLLTLVLNAHAVNTATEVSKTDFNKDATNEGVEMS